MPSQTPTVFLTGATGDIGSQTLTLLQSTHTPTRALCRRRAQVDTLNNNPQQPGVTAILGNLNDPPAVLASAIAGSSTLLLITAPGPQQLAQEKAVIDAALASGTVRHIVKIGASDQRPETDVPWARVHFFAEEYLRERCAAAGVSWTAVRPSGFMGNLWPSAPAVRKGVLPQTSGDGRAGWV